MPETLSQKKAVIPFYQEKVVESTGEFEGYGSVFNNIDFGGDIVRPGAFKDSLEEWMNKKQMPALFWMHNPTDPIGEWMQMREDTRGLYVQGMLWVEGNKLSRHPIERAMQARNLLLGTGPKGLSIGYRVLDSTFGEQDGRRVEFLEKLELMEVSVVGFGMNAEAQVTSVKSLFQEGNLPTKRQLEKHLRDVGFSQDQAKAFLARGYSGIDQREAEETEFLDSIKNLKTLLSGE